MSWYFLMLCFFFARGAKKEAQKEDRVLRFLSLSKGCRR
jgi:hypothetical protein